MKLLRGIEAEQVPVTAVNSFLHLSLAVHHATLDGVHLTGSVADDQGRTVVSFSLGDLRVECGPRYLEKCECVIVRRTDREKIVVMLEDLEKAVAEQLTAVHNGMFARAKKNLDEHIFEAHSLEEAKELQERNGGYIKTMWCGDLECELAMKEKAGMSSRCIPFAQEKLGETCACCGKPASKMIYWGVAY